MIACSIVSVKGDDVFIGFILGGVTTILVVDDGADHLSQVVIKSPSGLSKGICYYHLPTIMVIAIVGFDVVLLLIVLGFYGGVYVLNGGF